MPHLFRQRMMTIMMFFSFRYFRHVSSVRVTSWEPAPFTYLCSLVEIEIHRRHIKMRFTSRFSLLTSESEYSQQHKFALPRILVFISFELGQTPLQT